MNVLESLVVWPLNRKQSFHDWQVRLFEKRATFEKTVDRPAFPACQNAAYSVEMRLEDSPGDAARLVVQLADQPVATPHEPSLRRSTRAVAILDVTGIRLRSEQLIASDDADRVSAHSQEHNSDGYVAFVNLLKAGSVDSIREPVFLDREGRKYDPCFAVVPKDCRSGLRFRNCIQDLSNPGTQGGASRLSPDGGEIQRGGLSTVPRLEIQRTCIEIILTDVVQQSPNTRRTGKVTL